jgi:hypothetical protein
MQTLRCNSLLRRGRGFNELYMALTVSNRCVEDAQAEPGRNHQKILLNQLRNQVIFNIEISYALDGRYNLWICWIKNCVQVSCWYSGGNLGGQGGGRPPPHLHGKLMNFRKFWPKRGLKTVFSSANGGGGMSEIWKFCRKFRAPPPEKVNFRQCFNFEGNFLFEGNLN